MPSNSERSNERGTLALLFDFGELEVLRKMPKERRDALISLRKTRNDRIISRARRISHCTDIRDLSDTETETPRKHGEPDWHEVRRDAVRAVSHKLFGEDGSD
jgi:hypothetical protein